MRHAEKARENMESAGGVCRVVEGWWNCERKIQSGGKPRALQRGCKIKGEMRDCSLRRAGIFAECAAIPIAQLQFCMRAPACTDECLVIE